MVKKPQMGCRLVNRTIPMVLVIVSSALTSLPATADDWQTYTNPRFGTTSDIPAHGFTAQPAAPSADGQSWLSDDGRGQISVFADIIVTTDTVSGYRQELLGYARDDGLDIVYNVAKKNWFAYSGFLGDDIIYEKVVVTTGCDPMIGNHIYFRFPISQKAAYDEIVRRGALGLTGSRNADMCN